MRWFRGLALLALAPAFPSGCDSKGASAATEYLEHPFTVRVLEADGGEPVGGVRVMPLLRDMVLPSRASDEKGIVRWSPGVGYRPAGAARRSVLVVDDPEGRYQGREVVVDDAYGIPENVTIELWRGVTVRLSVHGSQGKPVAASLTIWSPGRRRGWRVDVSADGPAEVGPLAPGPTKIFVSSEGHETRVLDVTVPAAGGDLGVVELRSGGARLEGRASPEIRATDAYLRFGGAGIAIPVESDGSFEFRGLPEGEATLILRRHGRELFWKKFTIRSPGVDLGFLKP